MIPKKLKEGDKVIFKLAPTHVAPINGSMKPAQSGWRTGVITEIFRSGCLSIGNVVIVDNTPENKVEWGGIVIRYVGGDK